jgi:hypothetical protein
LVSAYSPHEHTNLARYAGFTAAFNAIAALYILDQRRSSRGLPDRFPLGDFLLLAAATHKLSRVIAKERVTSFLRSPFTRYTGEAGPSEVEEEPRGTGLRLAIGELLVCPYCVGQWVAGGFVAAYIRDRDATRMAASVFALVAASDFLHQAWVAAEKQTS